MLPLVALGFLVLLLASSQPQAAGRRPQEAPPTPTPPSPPKPPAPAGFRMVIMNPGETWGLLARSLKPMTDDAWSSFALNLNDSMRSVGASVVNFQIGTGGSFAFSIVPNIVIKFPIPSSSAEFRIEKAERLSAAPSV